MLIPPCSSGDSGLGKSTLINTLFEHKLYDLSAPRSLANGTGMNGNATGRTVVIESKSAGALLQHREIRVDC